MGHFLHLKNDTQQECKGTNCENGNGESVEGKGHLHILIGAFIRYKKGQFENFIKGKGVV